MGCRRLKKNRGFTLIELMVVMSIVAITYSLVGPNLFKSFDRTNFYADKKDTMELLKAISYKAFINSQPIEVTFSDRKISYGYKNQGERLEVIYEHIRFPRQQLVFSSAGFPDINDLKLNFQGKTTIVNLDDYLL
ncbi:type II secretion system protein [Thalassotalea euphylliae]|uniref:Type II secretion system protein n=1 Tax=Thalassotalea euphylliae TaxID=1655234 RepID=A0A3E0U7X5_9GAMM|nr:type II secretion system protein [Thalassotalea euphylliae]